MPFLTTNQQHQSTEGTNQHTVLQLSLLKVYLKWSVMVVLLKSHDMSVKYTKAVWRALHFVLSAKCKIAVWALFFRVSLAVQADCKWTIKVSGNTQMSVHISDVYRKHFPPSKQMAAQLLSHHIWLLFLLISISWSPVCGMSLQCTWLWLMTILWTANKQLVPLHMRRINCLCVVISPWCECCWISNEQPPCCTTKWI